jgi:ProP effector
MTEPIPSSPRPRAKPDSLEKLNHQFAVFREGRPLAIGIHKAIAQRLPELNASQVRIALKVHTGSTRYLKAVSQGGVRFDLDGEAAGPVTPEQQQQALNTLKERFRQQAALRKAELAAKEHQQNLQKLAEKFNTR